MFSCLRCVSGVVHIKYTETVKVSPLRITLVSSSIRMQYSLHVVAVSPGMRAVKPRSYSIIRWLPTVLAINDTAIGRVRPSVLPCVFTLTFELTDL